MVDVLVAGAGPAGWAAAGRCARQGLDTVLVAPRPRAPWRATYGLWADECARLPAGSRWVESTPRAIAMSEHALARTYAVLDNDRVREALAHPDVRVVTGEIARVDAGRRGCAVTLRSGRMLAAAVVINATGALPARAPRAEQTAFGVVLPSRSAAPLLAPGEALFMDWRPVAGFVPSTFLYAVPLPNGRVLLEETSLVRRPGLGPAELRERLLARLAVHGIPARGVVEHVRIPVDPPPPARRAGVIPFGAAAGLVHPASGYSLADTFHLAPKLAETISRTLGDGPAAAVRAARRAVWPPAAQAVQVLRRRGLAVLLGLRPPQLPEFFELFFGLPVELQRSYLSGREDVRGTARAMAAIFRAADRPMRATIARIGLIE